MLFDFLRRFSLFHILISVLLTVLAAVIGIVLLLVGNFHSSTKTDTKINQTLPPPTTTP